jgi:ElaB/YqjD/DUF883 family membrane-anchored ribosome-binding protein
MSVDTVEAPERERPSVTDRIVDAARRAAHLSHEARLVKSVAEDAIENSMHTAKRSIKSVRRGIEKLEDLRDEGIHYVKRQPLKTVAVSVGAGLIVGLMAGWFIGRVGSRRATQS